MDPNTLARLDRVQGVQALPHEMNAWQTLERARRTWRVVEGRDGT
jgi:hypothetical protein